MNIEKKQIAHNKVARTSAIKYIVVHDTANKSKGADADAHFNYFNGGNRNSSADFFVDDKKILQVNDYTKYYTWQVGDGKGKYGITNQNSIGIELCVNEDGNYNKAFCNMVDLTKYLMKELGIPSERVVRHYDASRKNCPASMSKNDWAYWQDFKNRIAGVEKMEKHPFADIKGHYAEQDILDLFKMGIVKGVTEGRYMPHEPISRADVAILIRRTIKYITGE
jgi:N-acetylmuramoyl-L-alanine amidase CwlA